MPAGSSLVLGDFDEAAFNRDLNQSIGGSGAYPYFRVVSKMPTTTTVSLEVPTLHDSRVKAWYEISPVAIRPTKILRYGPGLAFLVMPWSVGVGIVCVAVFGLMVRGKGKAGGVGKVLRCARNDKSRRRRADGVTNTFVSASWCVLGSRR